MPPIRFVPSTDAPTHPGRFLQPAQLGLQGRPGGNFLTDVFPGGWQILRAAFGADPSADPSTWTWTDITHRALWDDGIKIKIGYENESRTLTSASLTAKLRNDQAGGGDFTVDNPYGAYWPNVVENVPIWAQLDIGNGECDVFLGYATSWAPTRASGNADATVLLLANGVHRRIKQGNGTERSAVRRLIDAADPAPVLYYPCEDGAEAVTAASGLPGGVPMVASGGSAASAGLRFGVAQGRTQAAYTGYEVARVGVKSWVSLAGGGKLSAAIPPGTASTYTVQFANFTWAVGSNIVIARWATPGGVFDRYDVRMASGSNVVDLIGYKGTTATTILSTSPFAPIDEWEYVIKQTQNGANVDTTYIVQRSGVVNAYGIEVTDSRAGTFKLPTVITLNPDGATVAQNPIAGSENLNADLKFAHLAVWFGADAPWMNGVTFNETTQTWYNAWNGWVSEFATDRLQRLAREEGTQAEIVGTSDATMGFQDAGTFENLLMEPGAVDQGLLIDGLGWGYTYFTRGQATSQGAALVLDSAGGGDILGPNAAVHDDLERVTDYTATIPEGSSGRYAITPATGLVYRDSGNRSVYDESDLQQLAAWEVGRGSATGLRWPQLRFQLAKFDNAKVQAWLNCRPLSRIDGLGLSQGGNPDRSLALMGWRLQYNSKTAEVVANLLGYAPYGTTLLAAASGDTGEFVGWLDVDQVTVMTDVEIGGTSVVCAVIGPALTNPSVSTYTDDLIGLYINLDGMKVGVTAISAPDAAGWQTITVTGADVVRRVRAGAQVTAWNPVVLAL